MWRPFLLPAVFLPVLRLCAQQQIEVLGGSSSLYQSQGGAVTLRAKNFEGSLGGGTTGGRFVAGAHALYHRANNTYTAGIEELHLDLPTDLFFREHRLLGIGVGLRGKYPGLTAQAFAGATSNRFDTPLFQGVRAQQPTIAILMEHTLSPTLTAQTSFITSNSVTFLEAASWRPVKSLELALSAGTNRDSHYFAVSGQYLRPLADLKASYSSVSPGFRRFGSQPAVNPEPVGANALFTLRSSRQPSFTFTAGRQNLIVSSTEPAHPEISHIDQAAVSESLSKLGLTGSVLRSTYGSQSNFAFTASATHRFTRRFEFQTSIFESHLLAHEANSAHVSRSLVETIRETLSNRIAVSQNINWSGGQTNVTFGGTLVLSKLSLSAGYQTFYVPTNPLNPFQQSLILDLQTSLFSHANLHVGTFVAPNGKLLYTTEARTVHTRLTGEVLPASHTRLGPALLHGRVVDMRGNAISGAAIAIEGTILYTDSTGAFFLRESKATLHQYTVLLDQFLDGFTYRVISLPMEIASSKAFTPPALIVVTRTDDMISPRTSTDELK